LCEVIILATIATHNGTSLSQSHNQREGKASKDKHIDPSRTPQNETIYHERIQDAYSRLFDASVAEYDQKQHKGRKIGNYYDKIKADKKKNVAYELIVGVYPDKNTRDFTQEQGKEILKEYFAGWKERNPHLEAVGAYYHADEEGEPHLHIDYIPVATNCQRGPKTQTALVKALNQQGITGEKDKFVTAQMKWEARENAVLEGLCLDRGIEVRHPQRDSQEKTKHLDTPEYKQAQEELEKVRQEIAEQREAARLAAEKQAAEMRRLRDAHDKELAKEKKAAAEKLAKEYREHQDQLKFERENQAEELERQRTEQENQLQREYKIEKSVMKKRIEQNIQPLRSEVLDELIHNYTFYGKQIEEEINDIAQNELDIKALQEQKEKLSLDIKQQENKVKAAKNTLLAVDWSIAFAEENEIQPKKAIFSKNLVISPENWEKWQNNYKKIHNWWLDKHQEADELSANNKILKDAVSRKDKKIDDMTNIIKQKNAKIASLEAANSAKEKQISLLEKVVKKIKSGIALACRYFDIEVAEDIIPQLGDTAEALAERDKYAKFEDVGDQLLNTTFDIHEDALGYYALATSINHKEPYIVESYAFNTVLEGFENITEGDQISFKNMYIKWSEDNPGIKKIIIDYNDLATYPQQKEKNSSSGGGFYLGHGLSVELEELERKKKALSL